MTPVQVPGSYCSLTEPAIGASAIWPPPPPRHKKQVYRRYEYATNRTSGLAADHHRCTQARLLTFFTKCKARRTRRPSRRMCPPQARLAYYVAYVVRFAAGRTRRDAGDRDNRCAKKRKTATWFHYEIQRRGAERRGDVLASRLSPTLLVLRMLSSGIDTRRTYSGLDPYPPSS